MTPSVPKLNGTHQFLAYADDVNIKGGNVHTVKENAEAVVAATKEIGLEVNADKTKYMIMSRDQNAGQCHSMKIDKSSIERVLWIFTRPSTASPVTTCSKSYNLTG
jgi:hypothetical protein